MGIIKKFTLDDGSTTTVAEVMQRTGDSRAEESKRSLMRIQIVTDAIRGQYKVKACRLCTSLIANDLRYGRKANADSADLCEVCEVRPTKRN